MAPTMPAQAQQWLPVDGENNVKSEAAAKPEVVPGWELPDGKEDRKLVGVDGKWYDVTDFISRHPGGPIISEYIGKDATDVFHAMGHENVLKYRRPVGTYTMTPRHPADEDFRELGKFFKANGYFDTDWSFIYKKMAVCAAFLFMAFACVIGSDCTKIHMLGAVFLTAFWQQCGFFMHDFMHTQVFRDPIKDRACGTLFGTFFFGVSAHWWRDEHFVHHAVTCAVDAARRFVDPQMWEEVWAQHPILFPLFKGLPSYVLIKIQHITFIPVTAICGRVAIMIDSFSHERRWYEWAALIGHWTWISFLLSWLPTWQEVFTFYFIAAILEGILHFQLVFSHYCKPFRELETFLHTSWYVQEIESNLNIANPWWLDWFHGGLNFHIEHHCYPRLARHKLRQAGPHIEKICHKHGITYDSACFTDALIMTLKQLKESGSHYSLDPRWC